MVATAGRRSEAEALFPIICCAIACLFTRSPNRTWTMMATNHFLTGLYLDPLPGKWKMDEHGIIWSFSSDFHQVSMVLRGFVGRILNWDRQWHRLPVAIHGGSPHLINSLVGGLEHVLLVLFHIFGISSSQLTNSYFSIPPTSSWLGFLGSPESQPAQFAVPGAPGSPPTGPACLGDVKKKKPGAFTEVSSRRRGVIGDGG